jgi:hypothetical protein
MLRNCELFKKLVAPAVCPSPKQAEPALAADRVPRAAQ